MKLIKLLVIALVFTLLILPGFTKAQEVENPSRVIFIQNGGIVTDKNWNNGNTFFITPYNNEYELNQAIEIAKTHFDMFNILITTDKAIFSNFDVWHRTTIIVGSTDVLGPYTGYSLNNSYLWGDDTPGFVLTNNCNPESIMTDIGHLIAHESGHMFGLEHKLNPTSYYSVGYIMSNFTGKKFITWGNDDITALTPILGLKNAIL